MDSFEDVLPRNLPYPTQFNENYINHTDFAPTVSVPAISLLVDDLDRMPVNERPTFKTWRQIKAPQTQPPEILSTKKLNLIESKQIEKPAPCCNKERVDELNMVVDSQQNEIDQLRSECMDLRRDLEEMRSNFVKLSSRMTELESNRNSTMQTSSQMTQTPTNGQRTRSPVLRPRMSDPGQISFNASAATDKSHMMNNLILKYFPKTSGSSSKSSLNHSGEYQGNEKSIATMNYLQKYQIFNNRSPTEKNSNHSNNVLNISQLKRQSKLV